MHLKDSQGAVSRWQHFPIFGHIDSQVTESLGFKLSGSDLRLVLPADRPRQKNADQKHSAQHGLHRNLSCLGVFPRTRHGAIVRGLAGSCETARLSVGGNLVFIQPAVWAEQNAGIGPAARDSPEPVAGCWHRSEMIGAALKM